MLHSSGTEKIKQANYNTHFHVELEAGNKTIKPHLLKSLAGQFRILVFKIHFNLFKPNETLKLLYASKPCFTHQLVILPSNSACKECHLRYFHSSEDKTNYGLKAQPHEFFQTELDLPALKTHSYSTK